jgi:hypothetical protein
MGVVRGKEGERKRDIFRVHAPLGVAVPQAVEEINAR